MIIGKEKYDFSRSISTTLAAINATRTVQGLNACLWDEKPAISPPIQGEAFVMASETELRKGPFNLG